MELALSARRQPSCPAVNELIKIADDKWGEWPRELIAGHSGS
jgi:hypothetical protein